MKHAATPDTTNWWTASRGGAWRSGCTGCERTIEWVGYWRHVRRTPDQMADERETQALARALAR